MTLEIGNSHKFLAYHIRSAHLMFEAVLKNFLDDKAVSKESFYILRCDWVSPETSFDELAAHAILSRGDTEQAIEALIEKDYLSNGRQDGYYSLTPQGASLREKLLSDYRLQIARALKGFSDESIEMALSTLLGVQNNLQ